MYWVIASMIESVGEYKFGPFTTYETAEQCVIALARSGLSRGGRIEVDRAR